jgi:hypothetical protein
MRRIAALASTAVALTIVLGACGGDDSGSLNAAKAKAAELDAAAKGSTTTVKGGSTDTTTGDASTDTTDGKSTATTSANFSGKGSGDFCGFARDIEKNQNALIGDGSNPTDMKKTLATINQVFDEAAKRAPNEIKADFKTLQAGFASMAQFYSKLGDDPKAFADAIAKDPEAAQKALGTLSSPEFEAASQRIDDYMTKVCGIKSSDATDTTAP